MKSQVRAGFGRVGVAFGLLLLCGGSAAAQQSISTPTGIGYTQNFDGLPSSGGNFTTLPQGMGFVETGTDGDTYFNTTNGATTAGNTYSVGDDNERCFGMLLSATVQTRFGIQFKNDTGVTVNELTLNYVGEQWRFGGDHGGAADRVDFQYSLDATGFADNAGTWVDVNALDFVAPVTAGAVGALDGNLPQHRVALSHTVVGLNIPPGATFRLRWVDFDAAGSDDLLCVDDLSFGVAVTVPEAPVLGVSKSDDVAAPPALPGDVIAYQILVGHEAESTEDATQVVITDVLPDGVTAADIDMQLEIDSDPAIDITPDADGDEGEIVNGVVTVRLGDFAQDSTALLTILVVVDPRSDAGQLSNTATVGYRGVTASTPRTATSNEVVSDVAECATVADCAADTNPCTDQACTAGACVVSFNTAACDDLDAETRDDVCDGAGTCRGSPIGCPTPNQCQLPGVPDGDGCVLGNKPDTATCDDGDVATAGDHCDGQGACIGTPITCPADGPCATYAPNGVECVETLTTGACDDGLATTRGDVCAAGACQGTPYECTPSQCEESSVPNGVDCTITFKGAGAACDDGAAGTRGDVCDGAGGCAGTAYECTPSQCEASSVANGTDCTVTFKEVGAACDDSDACTGVDACDGAGACVGPALTCGEGEVCAAGEGCVSTHCAACSEDAACGAGSACVTVSGAGRCLETCATDGDCASGEKCSADAEGVLYCFDESGACALEDAKYTAQGGGECAGGGVPMAIAGALAGIGLVLARRRRVG